jgi:cytochrome c peroxidase
VRAAGAVLTLAALAFAAAALAGGEKPAGPQGLPRTLEPATNRANDAKVALGARLFADVRLSVDDKVACATCHVAELAFTDGHARARGHGGKELGRNAPTLLNVGLLPNLFWDGRAATLEEQARVPILHQDEMAMPDEAAVAKKLAAIEEYPPLFEKAFGDRAVTLQRVARALAAYERTLVAGDAPFDRWWRGDAGAMDEAARRGYGLFVGEAGCAQCHSIRQSHATFTDGGFHVTGAGKGDGRQDRGRAVVTGKAEDERAFRTPGLRNVAFTAPYMHDGSLATLEEVIDFYVQGGESAPSLSPAMRPLALDEQGRADLLAFLKALSSPKLPTLDACDALLEAGRPADAFEAYRRELDERSGGDRALLGLARAARTLGETAPLTEAERRLRRRVNETSPDRAKDGDPGVLALLDALAATTAALAPLDESMGAAREDDLLALWRRIRAAAPARDDAAVEEALLLERRDRSGEALTALGDGASVPRRTARASIRFRRGWKRFSSGAATDADRDDLRAAAEEFDALRKAGADLAAEPLLYRAMARHWLGDVPGARAAYLDAAAQEPSAEKALRGLRNLLTKDLDGYRADLARLLDARPASPALLYAAGWEALQAGRAEEAITLLRRRLEAETEPAPGTHVLLARAERALGRRAAALGQYFVAVALDGAFPGLVTETETYIRERMLRGFADVDALVAEYRTFLDAGPDDPRFQTVTRNNLAFLLRDVAASYTSRGPARLHEFAEGAPKEAHDVLRLSLRLYEEAAALVPEDADELPFKDRWIYAGVWNDLGLMLHYFPEVQDLPRAESCYLKAFDLTRGAYQDAYFYNLQVLYGLEMRGGYTAARDARWLDLAARAKDAILKEDPSSPTGFSPDLMKRAAARRDWERLSAALRR